VSKLDECKIVASEAGKAAGKSALISGGFTATIEIGTNLIQGEKINVKKIGTKAIISAINAGLYATVPALGVAMTVGRIGYSFFS